MDAAGEQHIACHHPCSHSCACVSVLHAYIWDTQSILVHLASFLCSSATSQHSTQSYVNPILQHIRSHFCFLGTGTWLTKNSTSGAKLLNCRYLITG